MVRKAEMLMTANKVLIPEVKMGVEAREQTVASNGCLEDRKVSKPHNPLVRYSEVFTHNLDLIAERKSVVYHLRELAKVSVMAKFLMDTGVHLDEAWFNMANDTSEACCMEVPQLWHSRYQLQINVQDGKLVESEQGYGTMRSVYGGVQFGLDRFQLSGVSRVGGPAAAGLAARSVMTARMGVSPMRAAATGLKTSMIATARGVGPMRAAAGLSAFRTVSPMRAAAGLSAMRMASPMRAAAGLTATRMMGAPRGVDLDLGRFDLSAPKRVAVGGDLQGLLNVTISEGFWANMDNSSARAVFNDKEKKLLQAIFHPSLCDRRDEGDLFAPPVCSPLYMQRLRNLVKEEEQAMVNSKNKIIAE